MAGESTSALSSLNFLGGDPLKAWFLNKQEVPQGVAGSSVVIERSLQIFATLVIIFIGAVSGLAVLSLSWQVKGILIFFLITLPSLTLFIHSQQRKGLFKSISLFLDFLCLRRVLGKVMTRLESLDHQIKNFYLSSHKLFLKCLGLHVLSRFLGVLEILILGRILNVPMNLWDAFFIFSVIPITNTIVTFIPGSVGVLEGIFGVVFHSLAWDPATGVFLQLVRRIRQLFWAFLAFLLLHFSYKKSSEKSSISLWGKISSSLEDPSTGQP